MSAAVLSWDQALERLEAGDRRLALAAGVVDLLYPEAAAAAGDIFGFLAARYPELDPVQEYIARAKTLAALQERFDGNPSVSALSGPADAPPRERYNIALLLSVVFTSHRFEIMSQLDAFLDDSRAGQGRIASVGTGTGYEVRMMASRLAAGWSIESYDIDPTVQADAQVYLDHFGVNRDITFGQEFPLDNIDPAFTGQYSAVVLCEVLEHLPDPLLALRSVREYLAPEGRVFLTMAVNIAQEDHIFWYPDLASCREQVRAAGLLTISEWIAPQATLPPPASREEGFRKGNYVAVAVPSR